MTVRESLYRPVKIGSLAVEGNLFLAPVAGWTDRAFRGICHGSGADLSFTELASAEALARFPGDLPHSKTGLLVRRGPGERRYGIQLFGSEPETLSRAARRLHLFAPDLLDLNAGCPVPKVVKNGAGSALMRDIPLLARCVAALVRASEEALGGIPVTVKIRAGWDAGSINYREAARAAEEAGAALITLHPRTRAQHYGGKSDWSLIADLAARLGIPVAGSGDLFSPESARRMLLETRCAAVMFARGAQGNPFIFAGTRALLALPAVPAPFPAGGAAAADGAPSTQERLAAAFRHLELLCADMGEYAACREMRKQFCAYTRGIPGGARLRDALVRAESAADFRAITAGFALEKPESG